jgi:hypothetical protein
VSDSARIMLAITETNDQEKEAPSGDGEAMRWLREQLATYDTQTHISLRVLCVRVEPPTPL